MIPATPQAPRFGVATLETLETLKRLKQCKIFEQRLPPATTVSNGDDNNDKDHGAETFSKKLDLVAVIDSVKESSKSELSSQSYPLNFFGLFE